MRIGVDFDGVCYQWTKTARYMLREVLPDSPYTKDGWAGTDDLYWNYIPDHCAPEHWKWLWTEGVRLGLFRHGHLFPGTIQALRQLAEIGDVIGITHRPKNALMDTLRWCSYHDLPLTGLHILTNQENKASVAECDAYIDDKPENCLQLKEAYPKALVVIPDRPWNCNFDEAGNGVVRVDSWAEFVQLVRGLK